MITAELNTGFATIKLTAHDAGARVHVTRNGEPYEMTFVLTTTEAEFLANALKLISKGAP